MNVTIINPEEVKDLFLHWGNFAKVCYDTQTAHPERIGKHCMNSGHFSGSRSRYIEFQVEGIPRFTIDQVARTEVGACKNIQSFRYVNKDSFAYEVPKEIIDNPDLLTEYHLHMRSTLELYSKIQAYVEDKTGSKERANEQARYTLPMATHSAYVMGYTIESLIHLMNERLCTRTEDIYRKLAVEMKKAVLELLPELEDFLVPSCQANLYCPEGKSSCGAYPTKKEFKEILEDLKLSKIKEEGE